MQKSVWAVLKKPLAHTACAMKTVRVASGGSVELCDRAPRPVAAHVVQRTLHARAEVVAVEAVAAAALAVAAAVRWRVLVRAARS